MFARGFKTWCETTALLQRKAIGLSATEPLNPHSLAKHLGIDVVGAEEVPGVDGDMLQVLLKEDPDSWSAITVSVGSRDLIILNSSHSGGRAASRVHNSVIGRCGAPTFPTGARRVLARRGNPIYPMGAFSPGGVQTGGACQGNDPMAWTTPTLVEICIGLEINGYLPAEF